jgi:class 3 adenylate cyclase
MGESGPANSQPGVLAHAQALRALRAGRVLAVAPAWTTLGLLAIGALAWFFPWKARYALAATSLATVVAVAATLALWEAGTWIAPAAMPLALWIGVLARLGHDAVMNLRERRRLRAALAPSVSPSVLREVLAGDLAPRLGGERQVLCVLFSDIRGFTTRSEGLSPEATVALLNRYFERMVAPIHAHDGTVTSFIGDGIMAIFGAPRALENPCLHAFAAARAMDAALADFNRELAAEGLPPVDMGIGLDTGPAVVGRIGTAERNDYTAIGDVANVASRVEGLPKALGCRLVCTGAVAAALPADAGLVPLGAQAIKGHTPVEVFGWRNPSVQPLQEGATRYASA